MTKKQKTPILNVLSYAVKNITNSMSEHDLVQEYLLGFDDLRLIPLPLNDFRLLAGSAGDLVLLRNKDSATFSYSSPLHLSGTRCNHCKLIDSHAILVSVDFGAIATVYLQLSLLLF